MARNEFEPEPSPEAVVEFPREPAVAPDDPVKRRLELLTDQVDALQIAIATKTPWYREAGSLLAALALIVSAFSASWTVYDTNVRQKNDAVAQEKRRKIDQIRDNLVQIADIRNEEIQETTVGADPVLGQQRSSVRNMKRLVLLETADRLAQDVRADLSAHVLASLGAEHAGDGDYAIATAYFKEAITKSTSQLASIGSQTGLAAAYMTPHSPVYDLERGRAIWRSALKTMDDRDDESAHFFRGQSYVQWAWLETLNGNDAVAAEQVANARKELRRLAPRNPAGERLLRSIAQYYDDAGHFIRARSDAKPPVRKFEGRWLLRYADHPERSALLSVVAGPQPNSFVALAEVSEAGRMIGKYSGMGVVDGDSLRIDWNGSKASGMGTLMPQAGVTSLRIRCGRAAGCGSENVIGEAPQTFEMSKP
ncbi:MAG TPA: hypothetical protein VFN10_00960 [Thermoanaerobaculia bacterium]|nr:hypothetical protein [Thermoanaerobaculia bacterium]